MMIYHPNLANAKRLKALIVEGLMAKVNLKVVAKAHEVYAKAKDATEDKRKYS